MKYYINSGKININIKKSPSLPYLSFPTFPKDNEGNKGSFSYRKKKQRPGLLQIMDTSTDSTTTTDKSNDHDKSNKSNKSNNDKSNKSNGHDKSNDHDKSLTSDQSNGYISGLISLDIPPSKRNKDNSIIEKRILTNNRLKKDKISCLNIIKDDGTIITGYAIAHPKRNKDFHGYFKEISQNEHLVNNFSCALQKEAILSQGMMFISLYHVCFHSNILGWVTNIVIPFSEIVEIEKKMTAYVIPNAIQITTKDAKYFFTSFLSRDSVYDLLIKIKNYSDSNNDNERCDPDPDTVSTDSCSTCTCTEADKKIISRETVCDCLKSNQHYDHLIMDAKFKGSIEKFYNLLYTSGFIPEFLKENNSNINMGEWTKNEEGNLVRHSNYMKQLNKAPGLKAVQCYLKEEVLHQDFDNFVTVVTYTNTPDVPAGGTFTVKTRTCIMSAGLNKVRVIVTSTVEFTGHSLFKSTIEKRSLEGQIKYYNELEAALRKYVTQNLSEFDSETASLLDDESDEKIDKEKEKIKDQEMKEKEEEEEKIRSKKDKNINTFKMPSIETLVIIVLLLTLIFNIYVLTSIRNVNAKVEFIEGQNVAGNKGIQTKSDRDYPLNVLLDELKRRRLFSISDDSFMDERSIREFCNN